MVLSKRGPLNDLGFHGCFWRLDLDLGGSWGRFGGRLAPKKAPNPKNGSKKLVPIVPEGGSEYDLLSSCVLSPILEGLGSIWDGLGLDFGVLGSNGEA